MMSVLDPMSKAVELDTSAAGQRFAFGENWARFLKVLDDERIETAVRSIQKLLAVDDLCGQTFLDVGCGSGLFSLAAAKLGAAEIVSFDYDPTSVACTRELKRTNFPALDSWTIDSGSCLDEQFLKSIPKSDVVYAWGVLHHTGDMWQALRYVSTLVQPKGHLVVSLYNQQPWSAVWRAVKRLYCSGVPGRLAVQTTIIPFFILRYLAFDVLRLCNPLRRYWEYRNNRGMSRLHDWCDWLGGYPFEVATPEEVFTFFRDRGFVLKGLKTVGGGYGCNEFVFQKQGT